MSLLKLIPHQDNNFDPIEEARSAFQSSEFAESACAAYVFGSALSERFSRASDIDILVVFETLEDVQRAQKSLGKRKLSDWPIDWVFKEKSDFEKRSALGGVCFVAKSEGVMIK